MTTAEEKSRPAAANWLLSNDLGMRIGKNLLTTRAYLSVTFYNISLYRGANQSGGGALNWLLFSIARPAVWHGPRVSEADTAPHTEIL